MTIEAVSDLNFMENTELIRASLRPGRFRILAGMQLCPVIPKFFALVLAYLTAQ
jgi:hypothetical protein